MPMPSQCGSKTRIAIVVIFTALKALKFAAVVKPSWQSTQATEAPSAYRNLLLSPSSKFPSKKIIVELFMFVIYVNLPSSCSCSFFLPWLFNSFPHSCCGLAMAFLHKICEICEIHFLLRVWRAIFFFSLDFASSCYSFLQFYKFFVSWWRQVEYLKILRML